MSWAEEQDWFGTEDMIIDSLDSDDIDILNQELDNLLEKPKDAIKKGYWIKNDYEPIALSDMTYEHICNCINMIENGRLDRKWALPYLKEEQHKRLKDGSHKLK